MDSAERAAPPPERRPRRRFRVEQKDVARLGNTQPRGFRDRKSHRLLGISGKPGKLPAAGETRSLQSRRIRKCHRPHHYVPPARIAAQIIQQRLRIGGRTDVANRIIVGPRRHECRRKADPPIHGTAKSANHIPVSPLASSHDFGKFIGPLYG
jgi:hypothetical protein